MKRQANDRVGAESVEVDYGWVDDKPPQSLEYIGKGVISALDRLGAKSILDVGCGNGALCGALLNHGYRTVAGVDLDKNGVSIARRTYPAAKFFELGVNDDPSIILAEYPNGFDAVLSTEVIEHLYAPRALLAFASRLLTEEGHMVISTPYHGYAKNLAIALLGRWDTHHTTLWEGGHIRFWSRQTLSALLESNGFRVVSFEGLGRVPFLWKSMLIVATRR